MGSESSGLTKPAYRAPVPPREQAVVVVEPSRGRWVGLIIPLGIVLAASVLFEFRSAAGWVIAVFVLIASYLLSYRPEARWFVVSRDTLSVVGGWVLHRNRGSMVIEGPVEVWVGQTRAVVGDEPVREVNVVGAHGHLSVRVVGQERSLEIAESLRQALLDCGALLEQGDALGGRILDESTGSICRLSWRSRPESFAREEATQAVRSALLVVGVVLASAAVLRVVGVCGGVLVGGFGVLSFRALREVLRVSTNVTRLRLTPEGWWVERSTFGWIVVLGKGRGKPVVVLSEGELPHLSLVGDNQSVELSEGLSPAEVRWLAQRVEAVVGQNTPAHFPTR